MSRQLMAILVSTVLVFGSVTTSAMSAPFSNTVQTDVVQTDALGNHSPLPAGRAAGIRRAQAAEIDPLLAIGIVAGIFILGVLLIGDSTDDDNTAPTTTGTF